MEIKKIQRVSNKNFQAVIKLFKNKDMWNFDRAYRNDEFVVLVRDTKNKFGLCRHIAIRNKEGTEIKWKEKQALKNAIFGKFYTAIEVFPSEDNLIDEANLYHLLILPMDYIFPFNLKNE